MVLSESDGRGLRGFGRAASVGRLSSVEAVCGLASSPGSSTSMIAVAANGAIVASFPLAVFETEAEEEAVDRSCWDARLASDFGLLLRPPSDGGLDDNEARLERLERVWPLGLEASLLGVCDAANGPEAMRLRGDGCSGIFLLLSTATPVDSGFRTWGLARESRSREAAGRNRGFRNSPAPSSRPGRGPPWAAAMPVPLPVPVPVRLSRDAVGRIDD